MTTKYDVWAGGKMRCDEVCVYTWINICMYICVHLSTCTCLWCAYDRAYEGRERGGEEV